MANKTLEALISIAGQVDPSLQKSLKKASVSFAGVKKAAAVTGAAVTTGMVAVTAVTAKAATALYDMGTEFDGAIDTIRVGTGATGEALDSLYSDMKEVYKDVPTTMEDASAAIADYNTRLGLTGEPLQELSKQAIQVSDMLGEDLSATIETSSKAFQQWDIEATDMSDAMDYIFKVSQSTGTGFNSLMTDMQSYGAQLQEMGFGFHEASALIGQLDKAGVNTSEVLAAMKKSVTALAQEGISASDGLAQYYDSIMNAKDATEATSIASEVFGTKAASTMVAAIRDGSLSIDDLTKSLEESGETINGAATDTYDFAEQFQLLKQNAQLALEPIAGEMFNLVNNAFPYIQSAMEQLMPIFSSFANSIIPVLENLGGQLFPIITDALGQFGEMAEELLPFVAKAVSKLIGFVSKILPILMEIAVAVMPSIEDALQVVFEVLDKLMPIFEQIIMNVLPVIQQLITILVPVITQLFVALSPIISLVGQLISQLLPPILSIIQTLMPVITTVATIISTVLSVAIQALIPVISGIISLVGGIADIFSTTFSGLVGIVSKPINGIISLVNTAIEAINGISVDIPDWVPVIGGQQFGFNIPTIPMLATGGFTDGVSIAGEAGTEAVISFDPAYRSENLSYWAKAGQMLGATDSDLLSLIEDAGSGIKTTEYNLGGVTFAPNITIQGNAQKQDVLEAIREAEPEFFDLLEEFMARRGKEAYGAAY